MKATKNYEYYVRKRTMICLQFKLAASITAAIAASSSCTPTEEYDFEFESVTTDLLEGAEHPSVTSLLQLVTQS